MLMLEMYIGYWAHVVLECLISGFALATGGLAALALWSAVGDYCGWWDEDDD